VFFFVISGGDAHLKSESSPKSLETEHDKLRLNKTDAVAWATLKNDLSLHNITYEDAIEMALDKPLWGLLAASGATH